MSLAHRTKPKAAKSQRMRCHRDHSVSASGDSLLVVKYFCAIWQLGAAPKYPDPLPSPLGGILLGLLTHEKQGTYGILRPMP